MMNSSQIAKAMPRAAAFLTAGVLAVVGMVLPSSAALAADEWSPAPSYTSTDRGDGTYSVPLVNSLFDRMDISDAYSLRNGANSYGQGQWASSLRYHDGTYYALVNSLNLGGAYIYRTDDIENGSWERTALGRSLHDPSLFFDEANGGTAYIFYGGVNVARLNPSLTAIEQDYANVIPRADYASQPYVGSSGLFEGAQAFYIDGYYYVVMITWPASGRQVALFLSTQLLGRRSTTPAPYESRGVLNSNGFAQGSLVPVSGGAGGDDWQGFFFRDTFPVGRVPALIPATWSDGWPTFGNGGTVPVNGVFAKPIELTPEQERFERQKSIVASDDFRNDAPHRAYQDVEWSIPESQRFDDSLLGVELLQNPGAESGTEAWIANDTATLSATSAAHSGTTALSVTARTTTGSGPAQVVTGKLQHGVTYDVSAWVKYDDPASPATKQFYITARYGGATTTYTNLTSATSIARGQWGRVSGTFTVPSAQALGYARIFIETPWTSNPSASPKDHLMDFQVDDASLIGRPVTVESPHPDEIAPNGSNLDAVWQWNHAPDNRYWSLTDRDGWLRLTNGKVVTGSYLHRSGGGLAWLEEARNTLSQRTFGPRESVETKIDISGMKDGDVAGLAAYNRDFSYIAVQRVNGVNTVGVVHRGQPFASSIDQAALETFLPGRMSPLGGSDVVHLKADLDFASSPGRLYTAFSYSLDGISWTSLGDPVGPLSLDGGLTHFMGHRVGLFSYATQQAGGHVDFDHFLLSDTLTAQNRGLDESALNAAITHASTLSEKEYPAQAWADMEDALAHAQAASASVLGTQNQIDAPERALSYRLAQLGVLREPASLELSVSTGSRCVAGKVQLVVSVHNADAVPAEVTITTPFGEKAVTLAAGASSSASFAARGELAAGEVP